MDEGMEIGLSVVRSTTVDPRCRRGEGGCRVRLAGVTVVERGDERFRFVDGLAGVISVTSVSKYAMPGVNRILGAVVITT